MRLIWYRRNDGLWNAACACNASIAGVDFEKRTAAEECHEQRANVERARRAADPAHFGDQIPSCGPKLPDPNPNSLHGSRSQARHVQGCPPMREAAIQSEAQLRAVLDHITFAPSCVNMGWQWQVEELRLIDGELRGWLVNTTFQRPDTNTGVLGTGTGRQELIAYGASESAVVKTCWLLAELIVRHELMEAFHYRGVRIFNPHHSVDELSLPAKVAKPSTSNGAPIHLKAVETAQRAMQLYRSGVMGDLDDLPEGIRDLILALDELARP